MARPTDGGTSAGGIYGWWTDTGGSDFVWDQMLGYWAATGQLDSAEVAPYWGGLSEDTFNQLGIRASYGDGLSWEPVS